MVARPDQHDTAGLRRTSSPDHCNRRQALDSDEPADLIDRLTCPNPAVCVSGSSRRSFVSSRGTFRSTRSTRVGQGPTRRSVAVNTRLVNINRKVIAVNTRLGRDITFDHPGDRLVITRTSLLIIRTTQIVGVPQQIVGRVQRLLAATNKWSARDIHRLIDMIADRSCGTYKGWPA